MARVKLTTSMAGPAGSWNVGDEYECDAAEAARLIEAGFAEPIAEKRETATKPAPVAKRDAKGGA